MPTLALLHRWKGAKFVTLHKKLSASVGSMRTTVDALIEHGHVMKNPGYGHPMRPEYVLTESGLLIGESCDRLLQAIDEAEARQLALSKWTMPVVYALRPGSRRFGQLRTECGKVTDRALTQALKALIWGGLVQREVTESYPPSVEYSLTPAGSSLLPHLQSLADRL